MLLAYNLSHDSISSCFIVQETKLVSSRSNYFVYVCNLGSQSVSSSQKKPAEIVDTSAKLILILVNCKAGLNLYTFRWSVQTDLKLLKCIGNFCLVEL